MFRLGLHGSSSDNCRENDMSLLFSQSGPGFYALWGQGLSSSDRFRNQEARNLELKKSVELILRVSAKLRFSSTCSPIPAFSVKKEKEWKYVCSCSQRGGGGRGGEKAPLSKTSGAHSSEGHSVPWRWSRKSRRKEVREGVKGGRNREGRWEGQSVYHCHHP